jgi:hypothetical protein
MFEEVVGRRVGLVSEFSAQLRRGIAEAQRLAKAAKSAGHPYEAYLHRARLADLIDLARRHGIDPDTLVEPELREALAEDEAALRE